MQKKPLYVIAMGAKSASDYYTHSEELDALMGEKEAPLVQKVMSCVRRVELKQGRIRPDLSYPAGPTQEKQESPDEEET